MRERIADHVSPVDRNPRIHALVSNVYELAKTLTSLDKPGAVVDPGMRVQMTARATNLAEGILTGPVEDIRRADTIITALRPDVSQRVRAHLRDTVSALESEK